MRSENLPNQSQERPKLQLPTLERRTRLQRFFDDIDELPTRHKLVYLALGLLTTGAFYGLMTTPNLPDFP